MMRSRQGLVLAFAWLTLAAHLLWVQGVSLPDSWRSAIGNAAFIPPFFLSGYLTLLVAREEPRNARTWQMLGTGLFLWGGAQGLYLLWDSVFHLPTFPSPADAGWLLASTLFTVGLFHLRDRSPSRLQALSLLLDTVMITLIAAAALWRISVDDIVGGFDGQLLPLAISLAYPAGDLLICSMLIAVTIWQPKHVPRTTLALLVLGFGAFLAADVRYAFQAGNGTYQTATLLDTAWSLAAVLVGTAATVHMWWPARRRVADTSARQNRMSVAPTYAVLLLFLTFCLIEFRRLDLGRLDTVETVLLVMIMAIFFIRQVVMLRDNQLMHARLAHRAAHDPLTGVRNRRDLEEQLQQLIDERPDGAPPLTVMFVDLDRMKQVNDTFGHLVGDQVLRVTASRLASILGPADHLARFGGDEFVLVFPHLKDAGQAAQLAEHVLGLLARSIPVGADSIDLTGSVGVAFVPVDAATAGKAIARADEAMYQAKQAQRNTWRFYNPELNIHHAPHVQMEALLRGALDRHEFTLVYQPLVNLQGGHAEGFEALMRWTSPALGPVPPSTFIPLAEASGMMGGLGRWVLREALTEACRWRTLNLPRAWVAVNISGTQFDATDFVSDVRQALADTGCPAEALMLEITESAVVKSLDQASAKLTELRALGVRIALDDFGMGYSSLGHLRHLPVNVLKIDRTFIREMTNDDAAFVRAIITMAASLGLSVAAEGIEEAQTAARLRDLGCDLAQGFHYGRPLPWAEHPASAPLPTPSPHAPVAGKPLP